MHLVNDYGHKIPHQSPLYKSMKINGSRITFEFMHTGEGLYCFDSRTPKGFAICGKDQKFVWAEAKIVGKDKLRFGQTPYPPLQQFAMHGPIIRYVIYIVRMVLSPCLLLPSVLMTFP